MQLRKMIMQLSGTQKRRKVKILIWHHEDADIQDLAYATNTDENCKIVFQEFLHMIAKCIADNNL